MATEYQSNMASVWNYGAAEPPYEWAAYDVELASTGSSQDNHCQAGFGVRFVTDKIKSNAKIKSAILTLVGKTDQDPPEKINLKIRCEKKLNASVFLGNSYQQFRNRALDVTTSQIIWNGKSVQENVEYKFDITNMVKEVLSLGDMTSIVVFVDDFDNLSIGEHIFKVKLSKLVISKKKSLLDIIKDVFDTLF